MKITKVECHLLTCKQRFSGSGQVYTSSSAIVRIVTDEGLPLGNSEQQITAGRVHLLEDSVAG